MAADSPCPEIAPDDFARRFSMRAGGLQWLLGAGASAAAGIPTAADMVWEFKQQLYVSQRRVSPKSVSDLANPAIRAQIQSHFEGSDLCRALGAADEYAVFFEAAYPSEADRSTYLDAKVKGAKPSYGHVALATLMRAGSARLVWTTNFDAMVADACARVYGGTSNLTSASLDAPDLAINAIGSERWPIEIKLHGDFRSRRLKNTSDELRAQDSRLRKALVDTCRRFGLVVAGYSGRDASIMDSLSEALDNENAFPSGLFWLHRGDEPPLQRVRHLFARAQAKGVECGLVRIESFDEVLRDLIRLMPDLDCAALDAFASERRIWTPAAKPTGRRGWPVLRFNALELTHLPTVCRKVVCDIGGTGEVRAAIGDRPVLAARSQAGVLAFGRDVDVRTALSDFSIADFSLHAIEVKRLRHDSTERGLLKQALSVALSKTYSLVLQRRRNSDLMRPVDVDDACWDDLRRLTGPLAGPVKGHPELRWHEGVGTRLDWAHDRLWLLVEPRTIFEGVTPLNKSVASDFGRERTVRRYNRQLNDLIAFWAQVLGAGGAELRALDIADGVDATFTLSPDTAYSHRLTP